MIVKACVTDQLFTHLDTKLVAAFLRTLARLTGGPGGHRVLTSGIQPSFRYLTFT